MVDKKLFTFKYERSDTVLSTPKTPVKRVPYKDIFSPKPERKKTESSSDFLIKIATGDFFEVFLRKESGADSKVCLLDTDCTAVRKTLGVIRNESERKDILREVEILKKVESPYVIKYIRDWEMDQHVFIEVEYCNLGTLRDYMNWVYFTQKSTFSKSLVKKIMTELVLGLQEIHRLKIVHLDLKPENIFLRSSVPSPSLCRSACTCEMPGEEEAFILKIGDFNISRYENEEMGMDGDKRYMAPEVLNGVCTRASDIYSLGLIYMEILNGIILPTSGEGWLRLRKNIFTGIKLEGPARKMLAKDYRKRIEASKLLTYFKMFTPVNIKKLTNVSIVTLKKFGKRYELAIYPNKLYEYQKKITTNLDDIVQNQTIFRNVSKGEVCSKGDLDLFGKPKGEIIREILEKGHEQKNEATRDKEASMAERELVDLVRWKVTRNGKFLNQESLRETILKIHKIHPGHVKKQAQEVVSKLEALGFERISFRIKVDESKVRDFPGVSFKEGDAFVNSSFFPSFRKFCEERKIPFVVHKMEEETEEEII